MTSRVYQHDYKLDYECIDKCCYEFEMSCCVQGYHVYQDTWTPVFGEQLVCRREDSNPCDRYIPTTPFYNLLSEGNYFTRKVSRLPTNP